MTHMRRCGLACRCFISQGNKPIKYILSVTVVVFAFGVPAIFNARVIASDEPLVVRTFGMERASATELEATLRLLLSPNGDLSVDRRTNSVVVRDTEASIDTIRETLLRLDAEMPSHTFLLNYADAERMAERIERVLGQDAIIEPDQRTHTVYVRTLPSNIERLKGLLPGWDRPARQVLIEADILDVSSAKLKELGIEWELRLGYSGGDHDAVININTRRKSSDVPSTGSVSFGEPSTRIPALFDAAGNLIAPATIIPGSDFSATIDALIEDSSTRTLSRPRILALDGHPARFEVSTLEPYANSKFNEYGAASSLDIQFLDIGIILETTPYISGDDYVTLVVQPEISTLVRDEFFETTVIPDEGGAITNTIRVPVKAQNRATTTVMVRDQQTIAIGGLRTRESGETVRKVPVLGDIPILGLAFRNLNQSKDKRELIIFITPRITSAAVSSPEVSRLPRAEPSLPAD